MVNPDPTILASTTLTELAAVLIGDIKKLKPLVQGFIEHALIAGALIPIDKRGRFVIVRQFIDDIPQAQAMQRRRSSEDILRINQVLFLLGELREFWSVTGLVFTVPQVARTFTTIRRPHVQSSMDTLARLGFVEQSSNGYVLGGIQPSTEVIITSKL